jgi:tetratricopeptide (TPR) repeat protein
LIAATSAQSTRFTEARIAGFPYAPAPVRTRDVSRPDVPSTIHDAAVNVERAAASHVAADHAAGIASLALGDLDEAIASLRRAAERSPGDARAWSDLSAALVTRAESLGASDDARAALAACDRALAASAKLPEALFNRALALEILGPSDAAARAWADYLRVDSTSKWSDEARARAEVLR